MRLLVVLVVLVGCGGAPRGRPSWSRPDAFAARIDEVTTRAGLSGVVLIGRGDQLLYFRPTGGRFAPDARWRWASVTKQVTAILILQEVAKGTIDLAAPISRYLPRFASDNRGATVEQVLRHQSGFPNPDGEEGQTSATVPAFYRPDRPDRPEVAIEPLAFCAGPVTGPPGGAWRYNNCDYLVAGALLEAVTGRTYAQLFAERIARPLGIAAAPSTSSDVIGQVGGSPEPRYAYERFGAAGSLVGTIPELWRIDRALLAGTLLDEPTRARMWDGKPELGFIALGQWVYEVPLRGCAKPVRLVERRGAIGGIGVRNFLVPALDLVVIAMTDRAEQEFGELWTQSGFAFELLSRAACATGSAAGRPTSPAPPAPR